MSIGWALGVALGVWVSGGISGGHINPAVTLALATFRGFSWKKVPVSTGAAVVPLGSCLIDHLLGIYFCPIIGWDCWGCYRLRKLLPCD